MPKEWPRAYVKKCPSPISNIDRHYNEIGDPDFVFFAA
jgi:hypothetical protein